LDVRIGLMGVGEMPMRAPQIEAMLEVREIDAALLDEAIDALRASLEPNSDLNASADYRRHLAGVLARRAISDAWARAEKGAAA
jgi:carbon-monoxide dehydrogenase medium subunit